MFAMRARSQQPAIRQLARSRLKALWHICCTLILNKSQISAARGTAGEGKKGFHNVTVTSQSVNVEVSNHRIIALNLKIPFGILRFKGIVDFLASWFHKSVACLSMCLSRLTEMLESRKASR